MPKELTHWWLAATPLTHLPDNSALRRRLEANLPAYLVGAVLPDTLLHLVAGSTSQTALSLAEQFHEPTGNSFTPLLRFINQHPTLTACQEACLLGVASHMLADIVFHPFVCAVSGNDIGEHYRVETELDLWLLHSGRKPPAFRLDQLLATEGVMAATGQVLRGLFDPDHKLPTEAINKSIRLHSLIQGMYGSPGWQLLAAGLALLPSPFLRSRHQLFYPFDWQQGKPQNWPNRWTDPTTGACRQETPEQLTQTAVERITELLMMADSAGLEAAFGNQAGENLVTGQRPHPSPQQI